MSHQNKQVAALRLGWPLAGMGVGGWMLACSALLWPAAAAVGEGSAGAPVQSAASRPISLNFQDVPLRQLLKVFADFTGLNLVASDSVSGQVSVRLQNVPWPQALDIVLRSKGHAFRQEGSVLWVAPEEEWTQRERKRLETRAAMEAAQPLETLALRLQYARATEVAQRLQAGDAASRWLGPRGSVLAEPRTNQLFVRDVASRLQGVRDLMLQIDVPVRQVMIEARIVEADDQFGESLGVRLGLGYRGTSGGHSLGVGGAMPPRGAGVVGSPQVSLPAGMAGQALVAPASMAVSLFNAAAESFINLELSALEAQGRGKVVSRPRVITADQTKALIEQGTELPYPTTSATGGTTLTAVTFRKAHLKLEVTPQITPDGALVLEVDVNRDSIGQLTAAGYAINTKHVKTQVQVPDGGTVVLGGIFEDNDKQDEAKVPSLGDVPVLGWLFRNRQQERRRSELLIFITPRVIAPAGAEAPTPAGPMTAPAPVPVPEPATMPVPAPAAPG
jgi:type IV pilus assembly protein PilQ